MRNEITTSSGAVRFISRTNNGENALVVNDQVVPSSEWTGAGNYTFEDAGVTFTIKKADDATGNIMMKIVDATHFELMKIPETAGSIEELAEEVAALEVEMTTKASKDVATQSANGLMSSSDKTKLDGIASGAEVNVQSDWSQTNNSADDYIKNKPGAATQSSNGLMSSADKTKLDGIESGAQVNPGTATQSSNGLMSSADKTKLDGIASGAEVNVQSDFNQTNTSADDYIKNKPDMNDYLPKTGGSISGDLSVSQSFSAYSISANGVSATYIDLNGTRLKSWEAESGGTTPSLVTTGEKYNWNNKAGTGTATESANGLMSSTDKTKLDGIASGAEVNVQSDWSQTNNASDDYIKNKPGAATQSANGLMSSTDKTKLDGIASGAEVNVQSDFNQTNTSADDYIKNKPDMNDYLPKTGGSISGDLFVSQSFSAYSISANGVGATYIDLNGTRLKSWEAESGGTTPSLVTTGEKADWNAKASTSVATQSANGLMSSTDKTKLDGIASGAEVNVQSDWSQTNNASDDYIKNKPGAATQSSDGLMSSGDKTKLDGIESGAQVNPGVATQSANGLMSSGDKTKLDGIDTSKYLPIAGGTMTGTIVTPADNTKGIEPATNNYGRIGSSSKKYYNAYIANIYYGSNSTKLESKAAASGGTATSLVTTGEKYDWNNKVSNTGGSITGNLSVSQTLSAYSVSANGVYANYLEDADGVQMTPQNSINGAQLQLKNLGTSYTAALKSDISSGAFKKAVVGGYLTINGHKYYLAHPDYWLGSGSTECTTHHMVVIAASYMGSSQGMNSSLSTTGAYTSSVMRTSSSSALAAAKATIVADFGAANILTHKELFANAVASGKASGWAWADSDVDIPNEVMIFGCNICTAGPHYDTGIDRTQLKLFAERPDLINLRENWWLRCVTASDSFGFVGSGGQADSRKASYGAYVRPVFAIC